MHAAVVTEFGQPPKYTSVADLPPPPPEQLRLRVLAAGVPNVARMIAAGEHFITASLPYTAGIDGVGVDESVSPAQRYYFSTLPGNTGSLSEYVNIDRRSAVALPDGIGEASVAALVNPAQSSWMDGSSAPHGQSASGLVGRDPGCHEC